MFTSGTATHDFGCALQGSELHKVEDGEEPAPSTEHVETRRQKAMHEGKE